MGDSLSAEKPRKLLRWAQSCGDDLKLVQGPGPENENQNSTLTSKDSADEASEKPGSNSNNPDLTVVAKREDWYGAKMKRLKDSVEKLRKDLRDKERDYIRLKNKYNVSKRRQEQLQEDLRKHTEVKLDVDSELEFLNLQLLEKEKELLEYRKADPAFIKLVGKGDKVKSEANSEVEDDVGSDGISLESCSGDSIFARKYLNLHKHFRRLLIYGILGIACCSSLVALISGSSLLSSFAVGPWTLGLFCLWQERRKLYRVLKLKHGKKIQEMSACNALLREEKRKVDCRKKELEKELHRATEDKNEIALKFMSMSEKLAAVKARNEEMVKRDKYNSEKLQNERIRRRRAEERLEEVTAQALLAREENELAKCGDICKKLRSSLNLEREQKERLSRENKRLLEEIVAMNMKEEKQKMEWEKEKVDEQLTERKEMKNDEEIPIAKNKVEVDKDGDAKEETKTEEVEPEEFESKSPRPPEATLERSLERQVQASKERENQISASDMGDGKTVEQKRGIVLPKLCWFCLLNIPTEIRLALCIALFACFVPLLNFILFSKIYLLVCILCMFIVGAVKCYQVTLDTKVNPSG